VQQHEGLRCRGQRLARRRGGCRRERSRALALYNTLTPEQKDRIPQQLRIWLRYRSERYFGFRKNKPKKKRKPEGKAPGGPGE
jgi:hypothetical protein